METFTGLQYLKMDIASSYGLDKANWDVRLKWFEENQHQLHELRKKAENPALYFAGIKAWEDVQAGKPSGYPISLDATASCMQILACLTGDRNAARICNVISTGHREDAYTHVWQTMQNLIGGTIKITRQQAKDAVMPSLYGSEAEPKKVFGDELLPQFEETMTSLAPEAWKLNKDFLSMWHAQATHYSWVLPDNFHVHMDVTRMVEEDIHFLNQPFTIRREVIKPKKKGRSLGANTVHSVDGMICREMSRRCNYDAARIKRIKDYLEGQDTDLEFLTKQDDRMVRILWKHYLDSGYLSARILDHLDPVSMVHVVEYEILELIESLPKKPFQVIAIHDAFRCLPNYGNDLRIQYARQLYLIAKSNLLDFIVQQFVKLNGPCVKADPEMYLDILDSEYALS